MRFVIPLFAFVALVAPASLWASCGSESCPLDHMGRWSEDPLDRSLGTGATSHWVPREKQPLDPESYRKQF